MLPWDAPVVDVRPRFASERRRLVRRLAALPPEAWIAPTALPGWTVKDIALHLLDDDFGRLARSRDDDRSGLIEVDGVDSLVRELNAKNQRWVDGAQGLSRRLVAELLAWTGAQLDDWFRGVDLLAAARVEWAGDGPLPMWLDLARELTERWVHHQQILDALGERDPHHDADADAVLATFVWAFPHQYRVAAAVGTCVELHLGAAAWTLTRRDTAWELEAGRPADPAARVVLTTDQAWRTLTGGAAGPAPIERAGPDHLVTPLLDVRAVLV